MKWISSVMVGILSLIVLNMATSASLAQCDDPWCNGILPTYGPVVVVPGESITLTAPGPWSGYAYSWANYLTGTPRVQSDGGSAQTDTLTIPSDAANGDDFGAVLTLTENHGTGSSKVSCINWACIWMQAAIVPDPQLNNFCHGLAQSTDGFAVTMPDAAITYKWFIDGTEKTINLDYLNGLSSGAHTAVLKLYRGSKVVKTYNTITFNVYAQPTASISYQ